MDASGAEQVELLVQDNVATLTNAKRKYPGDDYVIHAKQILPLLGNGTWESSQDIR
jgi:hypothetical protein